MKKVVLTGGGTSGHVTPNIALFPFLKDLGYDIEYIGSIDGMEKGLILNEDIKYYGISSGKLRRYIDFKNITDIFKIIKGFFQAINILRKVKPDIVFSKGGFVSCPVVWGAWVLRIPIIIHESDFTPGLTNKLSIPFAKKVCYTFPETQKYLPQNKAVLTGIPIRQFLFDGDDKKGRELCGFDEKPVVMIIGGSQGAESINNNMRKILDKLLEKFNICHICGKGNVKSEYNNLKGYYQFEYVNNEQKDLFKMTDVVVSRAGATTLFELLQLNKPNILIPLSKKASRGDQILNANSFKTLGFSEIIEEEEINEDILYKMIIKVYDEKENYKENMKKSEFGDSIHRILKLIDENSK